MSLKVIRTHVCDTCGIEAEKPVGWRFETQPAVSTCPACSEIVSTHLQQWEEWFALVGLTDAWNVIKENFPDDARRIRWEQIIEMNRLSELQRVKDATHT